MQDYQQEFIELAIDAEVLRFGEFRLKSGRVSPYFFNAGLFNTGAALARLGDHYAAAVEQSGIDFDVLFGPAYKGIPLVTATATALARNHRRDVPWCFNRKEAKDHGEGGVLVGAPMRGRVLLVDDVITAGTAIGESVALIDTQPAELVGVIIALDRQETGEQATSAVQQVAQRHGVPVYSIVTLADLVIFLAEHGGYDTERRAIADYQERYGVTGETP